MRCIKYSSIYISKQHNHFIIIYTQSDNVTQSVCMLKLGEKLNFGKLSHQAFDLKVNLL